MPNCGRSAWEKKLAEALISKGSTVEKITITNPDLHSDSCLILLQTKGYTVSYSSWFWYAENDKVLILAQTPLELLGAVALWENKKADWHNPVPPVHIAQDLIKGAVEKPPTKRYRKVTVSRSLPWICPKCKQLTVTKIEAYKVNWSDKLQLRATCETEGCVGALSLGDAEPNFEIITKEGDYMVLRYIRKQLAK